MIPGKRKRMLTHVRLNRLGTFVWKPARTAWLGRTEKIGELLASGALETGAIEYLDLFASDGDDARGA
jgi:hypothetical protein